MAISSRLAALPLELPICYFLLGTLAENSTKTRASNDFYEGSILRNILRKYRLKMVLLPPMQDHGPWNRRIDENDLYADTILKHCRKCSEKTSCTWNTLKVVFTTPPWTVMTHGIKGSILRILTKTNDVCLPLCLRGPRIFKYKGILHLIFNTNATVYDVDYILHPNTYGRPSQWNGWQHLDNLK